MSGVSAPNAACEVSRSAFLPTSASPSSSPLPSPPPSSSPPSSPSSRSSSPASPLCSSKARGGVKTLLEGVGKGGDGAKPKKMIVLRRGDFSAPGSRPSLCATKERENEEDAPGTPSNGHVDGASRHEGPVGEVKQAGDQTEDEAAGGRRTPSLGGVGKSLEEREREYNELRARIFSASQRRSPASSPSACSPSFRPPRKNLTRSYQDRFDPEFMRSVIPPPGPSHPPLACGASVPSVSGLPRGAAPPPSPFRGSAGQRPSSAFSRGAGGHPRFEDHHSQAERPSPFVPACESGRSAYGALPREARHRFYGDKGAHHSGAFEARTQRSGFRRDPRLNREGLRDAGGMALSAPGGAEVHPTATRAAGGLGRQGEMNGLASSHEVYSTGGAIPGGDPTYGLFHQDDGQGRGGGIYPYRAVPPFAYPGFPAQPGCLPNPGDVGSPYSRAGGCIPAPPATSFSGVQPPLANVQAVASACAGLPTLPGAGFGNPCFPENCLPESLVGFVSPANEGWPGFPVDGHLVQGVGSTGVSCVSGCLYTSGDGAVSPSFVNVYGHSGGSQRLAHQSPNVVPPPPPPPVDGVGFFPYSNRPSRQNEVFQARVPGFSSAGGVSPGGHKARTAAKREVATAETEVGLDAVAHKGLPAAPWKS
ncbi:conserved hypothetical protein [Neospora caninum Liverpool]|nr:conserved hypothetical protein [Neospora caninum Liverpool]CBZ53907.1 conserved hypothetical protein [Neospora caninum Liverpool]|eukprot:XP_003883939.1 conserved hypothetical protein [Neospora caninum Liverpool]